MDGAGAAVAKDAAGDAREQKPRDRGEHDGEEGDRGAQRQESTADSEERERFL